MGVLSEEISAGRIFTGTWVPAHGGTTDVHDVATGATIGRVGLGDAQDVDAAGRAARAAQPAWAATPPSERAAILLRAADALERLSRDERVLLQREEGAIAAKVDGEIHKSVEELRAAAGLVDQPYGDLLPHEDPAVLSMARRVPAGVIGVIAPWNAPMLLAMRSVAPALALGNAVILKPDVKTAVSGGTAIALAFEEAGLPEGVLHVIPGGPETGQAVVASPHTDVISFTGSTAAGRRVGEVAGGLLKKVVLELGGNNALIVLEDANLDEAIAAAVSGSLLHNGQICMATGRHLVHESIADEFTRRLHAAVAALPFGDPTDAATRVGPLISELQASRVQEIVDAAVAGGAEVLTGGTHEGPFFRPTVLDKVVPGNAAFEQEIFGPVLPIVRFTDDAHAIELANATPYGLSAAIHTGDMSRGLALAGKVRTGMVHINGITINDSPYVPMGGMGQSGNGGRYGGHWNLDEFTSTQWVTARSVARG
ncbi:MAG: aldehyde dehydrogenase family protein [Actinobacteria bacterium]|nr:aldehyde dehydrogenase family protein [Actinomycetota bacterium]